MNILNHNVPLLTESIQVDFEKTLSYTQRIWDTTLHAWIHENHSCYPLSELSMEKVRSLYQARNITWIEAAAKYEEQLGECQAKDGKDGSKAFTLALRLYTWMNEQSDYVTTVYPGEVEHKRAELDIQMDCVERKIEVCQYLSEKGTRRFLENILHRLKTSGHIYQQNHEKERLLYLLSYDREIFQTDFPLIVHVIEELLHAGILNEADTCRLQALLSERMSMEDLKINGYWFAATPEKLFPPLRMAIQLIALLLLLSKKSNQNMTDRFVLSARLCRYLSCFPSTYAELLRNKSYTLLAGETTLNERIQWNSLYDFDEIRFISQLVTIPIHKHGYLNDEQDDKWLQYSSRTNTLTLDHDGFTISPRFPALVDNWKMRKDRAQVLNRRLFVTSFSKLPCTYEQCKTIKDFRIYWKQLSEDFPFASGDITHLQPRSPKAGQKKEAIPEWQREEGVQESAFPVPNEEVTVKITAVDKVNQSLKTEILTPSYRGMKARLPFAYINSCYSMIPEFANLFTENEIFKVKVKQMEKGEIILSLVMDYNESLYAENSRQRHMIARIVEVKDRKVWWLLSTGVTATTTASTHRKHRIGDFYKVEYLNLLSGKLNNTINVHSYISQPDEKAFNATVIDNLHIFFSYKTKEVMQDYNETKASNLKNENNPFFLALQNLDIQNMNEMDTDLTTMPEPDTKDSAPDQKPHIQTLSHALVEELIYCTNLFIEETESLFERFNAYNVLLLLSNLAGNERLAHYYSLCADYIYNVDALITELAYDDKPNKSIRLFEDLQTRMCKLGIQHYCQLCFNNQVIQILLSLFNSNSNDALQSFRNSKDFKVAELARYFSIVSLLNEKDSLLRQEVYKSIYQLLGAQEIEKKTVSHIPVFFGHEGVNIEFKTSAFIHPEKKGREEQFQVLARVIASFMNTDGGTLYIGVNDMGYLSGLVEELRFSHNDSDVYHRMVNTNIMKQLGEKTIRNRYQEYIRSSLYEYEDGRMVLAFRVAPINDVVKVSGIVYTRSASMNTIKPVENVAEFIQMRKVQKLDSTPLAPEFPNCLSQERGELIFDHSRSKVVKETAILPVPKIETEPAKEPIKEEGIKEELELSVRTSTLRVNPLQKKVEQGYTCDHLFVSLFPDGKIASSVVPKIGQWGKGKQGKVVFSYNPKWKEDLLVSVFRNGEVGISNMRKGISQQHVCCQFVDSPHDLFFISPATKQDFLLLISEKNGEKRYRIIKLDDFEKSMSIQPRNTLVLEPDKGTFIYAEILPATMIDQLTDDRTSLTDFDQYNAGRSWEHTDYRPDVEIITSTCTLTF